ncbi:MAG: cupin domain-containing protein [Pseudomonadota bacterium]
MAKDLQIARFCDVDQATGSLVFSSGPLPVQMAKSQGTALPLVRSMTEPFGADVIRFAPGEGVALHTHEGDHILVVVEGRGRLTYGGETHKLDVGTVYFVPGSVPHAIDADTTLSLISIGNQHVAAASAARLDLVSSKATD